MKNYNRKDDDGHKFLVPEDLLTEFDDLFDRYCNAEFLSKEYYELESEFCNKFQRYMVN